MSESTAILLGIVQGLTEFLPISSSGHLVIAQQLMEDFKYPGFMLEIILHLGTLGAVLLYFRSDIAVILSSFKPNAFNKEGWQLIRLLTIGTLPAIVAALTLHDAISSSFEKTSVVGISLGITGICLIVSSKLPPGTRKLKELTSYDAFCVGLFQSIALVPGISRSGFTIVAGLNQGLSYTAAARFSFLLSIPAIIGAATLNARDIGMVDKTFWVSYLVGFLTAFVIGYLSIGIVMRLLECQKFHLFGYYCISMGGAVLAFA